jgi:S-adenosylmethionine hydrolase
LQIVTLLTDFGTSDSYVAQMKGIIYSMAPDCLVVDLTHQIPAQCIFAGARALRESALHFPVGTIHVAVVDPGVGTRRRLIAAKLEDHFFVFPDNGLLGLLANEFPLQEAVELTEKKYWRNSVSHSFHGRDIMAPVAAHLATGIQLSSLGQPVDELAQLQVPGWEQIESGFAGAIVAIDHFGNAITNLPARLFEDLSLERELCTLINERQELTWRWCAAYGFTASKTPIALIGSHGSLELAVNCGSAAAEFKLRIGDRVQVYL